MFRKLVSPIFTQWEVTPNCNYKCIHCYNAWRREEEEPPGKIDNDYYKITKEIIQSKILHVTITGGEPLIVYTQIVPCIKALIKNGISVSINTNASLATKEICNDLKKLGISSVLVSLVSGNEKNCNLITQNKNSYLSTLDGIKNLCNAGLNVFVNMVVTTLNIRDIYDTAKLVKQFPIKQFSATKASTPCNYEEFAPYRIDHNQLEYLFNELIRINYDFKLKVGTSEFYPYCAFSNAKQYELFGEHTCSAGKTNISISYDGKIRACPHSNKSYGHYSDGIINAWNKMDIWRETNIPLKCRKCRFSYICSGGCKEESFNAFGNYNSPDPYARVDHQADFSINNQDMDIPENCEYLVSSEIKLRKEEIGSLIYTTPSNWVIVGDEFANYLISHKNIFVKDIFDKYDIIESKRVIIELLKKHLLVERINKNE